MTQSNEVSLVWSTPNGQALISEMARVSNPANATNTETASKLIQYLIKNKHWSPFEMVSVCFSIKTSRAVSRQILRHRSFSFQEFSQRYADVSVLGDFNPGLAEARTQDSKNRQSSHQNNDPELGEWWNEAQIAVNTLAVCNYNSALKKGIAKEVARVILPEGLTPTHLYMAGTLRSWIHFTDLRCGNGSQLEVKEIADKIKAIVVELFPDVFVSC